MKSFFFKHLAIVAAIIILAALCAFLAQERPSDIAADSAPAAVPSTSVGQASVLEKVAAAPPSQPPDATRIADVRTPPSFIAHGSAIKPAGRVAVVSREAFPSLGRLSAGDAVSLPLMDGRVVAGRVNLVKKDLGGWVRVGGQLTGPDAGSFTLGTNGEDVNGTILLPKEEIAYEIAVQSDGKAILQEKLLAEVVCLAAKKIGTLGGRPANKLLAQAIPPILSSRPCATAVLYLDFDGETGMALR